MIIRLLLLAFLMFPFFAHSKVITLDSTNFVFIAEQINSSTVAKASHELMQKCRDSVTKELYLVLYSPGGSVSDGKSFIDFARAIPCKIKPIALFAASMAYQIFQSLDTRYVQPSSIIMSHRASISGLGGQIPGELISFLNFITDMVVEMEIQTAKRIGISLKRYQKEIYDELWLTGTQALSRNHADEEVLLRCNESLQGIKTIIVNTFFGDVSVTISECPIITGPLAVVYSEKANIDRVRAEVNKYFNPLTSKVSYEY